VTKASSGDDGMINNDKLGLFPQDISLISQLFLLARNEIKRRLLFESAEGEKPSDLTCVSRVPEEV